MDSRRNLPRCQRHWGAVGAATIASAVGAIGGTAAVAPAAASAQSTSNWHIVVYTVNDSSGDLPLGLDIDEMIEASRSGVSFTVFVDGSSASDPVFASSSVPTVDEAMVIEIAGGAANISQRLGEVDSGSPDTLGWFIAEALVAHPSPNAALVVWDHGSGWQGIGFDEDYSSTGQGRRTSAIDAAELGTAMAAGLAAAGRQQFDLVTLDACLMANYDVLSAVSPSAHFLLSSEELVSGVGLNYDAFSVLADPAAADPVTGMSTIFDAVMEGFQADILEYVPSDADMMTWSLVDLTLTPTIDSTLAEFTRVASIDVAANPEPYLTAAGAGLRYGDSGDWWPGFLDLGEFLGRLSGVSPEVSAAAGQLLAAIDSAVLHDFDSESYASATGLTVYFPTEPRDYFPEYAQQPSSQAWQPFLSAFYDAQAAEVTASDVGYLTEMFTVTAAGDGNYVVEASVTNDFNGSIHLLLARPAVDGSLNFFRTDSGEVINGAATALARPTFTMVSDGTNSAAPFTRNVREEDGWHRYSLFTLQHADGTLDNLNWDRSEQDSGPLTVISPNGTIIGYTPAAGDLAYPIVMAQQPGAQPERAATAPALDPTVPWTVTDEPLPAESPLYLELQMRDAAGNVVDSLSGYIQVGT
ncbi:hypothetical protein BH24ACT5_BH24ACT5_05240 [soil metagenome]